MSRKAEVVTHWKRMREDAPGAYVTNHAEAPSGTDCAYCEKYYKIINGNFSCTSCPISVSTGMHGCSGTPFGEARLAWIDYKDSGWDEAHKDYWQLKADEMIAFLEELPDE